VGFDLGRFQQLQQSHTIDDSRRAANTDDESLTFHDMDVSSEMEKQDLGHSGYEWTGQACRAELESGSARIAQTVARVVFMLSSQT
jgi:hypothetical protein